MKTGKANGFIMRKSGSGLGAQPPEAKAFKKIETSFTMKFGNENWQSRRNNY